MQRCPQTLGRLLHPYFESAAQQIAAFTTVAEAKPVAWVFLGPPGVGKGTYSTRVAEKFGFLHIAAGDIVRAEIRKGTPVGQEMADISNRGHLLPDALILRVIREQFLASAAQGIDRFLLDGFPRTVPQAEALEHVADVQLALNLDLREEVLVDKCLGRRMCRKCGKNFNIADIHLRASHGRSEIIMPSLPPPASCEGLMEKRDDDTEETIRRRLKIYRDGAAPLEDFYRRRGTLMEFEITAGIPETLPALLRVLEPYRLQAEAAAGEPEKLATSP